MRQRRTCFGFSYFLIQDPGPKGTALKGPGGLLGTGHFARLRDTNRPRLVGLEL